MRKEQVLFMTGILQKIIQSELEKQKRNISNSLAAARIHRVAARENNKKEKDSYK